MLFNSASFMFGFLPTVLVIFFLLERRGRHGLAVGCLTLASLLFYGWDDPRRLLPIILASMAFNLAMGQLILRTPRRALLTLAVGGNLALLAWFKYAGFLLATLGAATGQPIPTPAIVLPIGISFFTFTQIAFLVDAFRGRVGPHTPLHYPLFVSFFPHLVAGPIYHHREIMPQFERRETTTFSLPGFTLGLTWFALGLAKKVLLADPIAGYATPVFAAVAAGRPTPLVDAWIGVLSFALQLYYDFSGYSDMAIGLALMIGIRFPLNFDSPYKASSLIDFWRRWHMTLSRFLRDYLYIPLGGNRQGTARRYVNLVVTMLLGGLWHGASWNFVAWGGLHGAGLIVNHAWRTVARPRGWSMPTPLGWALTFAFVLAAWVPFRADTLSTTLTLWKSLVGKHGLVQAPGVIGGSWFEVVIWVGGLLAVTLIAPNTQQILPWAAPNASRFDSVSGWRPSLRLALTAGIVLGIAVALVVARRPSEFLYFRF